jgi:hypothetical protein
MATNTGRTIAATYKNLLNIDNNNSGVDGTVRTVQDGEGTASALQLSQSVVNVNGTFQVGGVTLTADVSTLNNIAANTFTALTAGAGIRMTVDSSVTSTAQTSSTILVSADQNFGTVSVSTGFYSTGITRVGVLSATTIDTDELLIAGVSAATVNEVAAVSALVSTNAAQIATVSAAVSANTALIAATSAALATSISNVSATMATSIANVSAALESRIAAVSALTSVNLESTTSITSRITALSATFATSINNEAVTRAATSAALATSIANVSSTMATSIANHLPLAGGTITGTVSAQEVIVSSLGVNTSTTGKRLKINGAAVAELASLTDGTSIAVNFNTAQNFVVQLKGNRTFESPTNCVAGQTGSIFIVQDGTGSRTGAWGTNWKFVAGTAPTLSTGVSAVDRVDYIVYTSTAVHAIATLDLQ